MKKLIFLFSFFFMLISGKSQQTDIADVVEVRKYQYDRILEINPQDSTQLLVAFIFKNKEKQIAITYRQEYENSNIVWIETGKAILKKNNIVESLVENLAPEESVRYEYSFSNVKAEKNKIILEKAALLIMNDEFEVEKIVFDPEIVEFSDSKLQENKNFSHEGPDDSKIQELEN